RLRRRQTPPQLLARVLVKCDRDRAVAADDADEALAVEQRMSGESPVLWLGTVLVDEIALPERFTGLGVEATQIAHRAERVHFAAGHARRRPRPGGIGDAVLAVVFVLPDDVAGGLVQAQNSLAPGQIASGESIRRITRARLEQSVRDVNAAAGDGRA